MVLHISGAMSRVPTLLPPGTQKTNSFFGGIDCLGCVAVVDDRIFALNEGWFQSVDGNPGRGPVPLNPECFLAALEHCMRALVTWLKWLLGRVDSNEDVTDLT